MYLVLFYILTFSSSRDKDHNNGGDGIPAFYLSDAGHLCLSFPLNNKLNYYHCKAGELSIKKWHNLVFSSVMENSQVRFYKLIKTNYFLTH